jgi:hypothetical protein
MKTFLYVIAFIAIAASSASAQVKTATALTGARIYDRPSVIGEARGDVPKTAAIRVLDAENDWYVVRIGDVVGWMPASSLRISATAGSLQTGLIDRAAAAPRASSNGTGKSFIRGPRGGCYYISGSGKKVYVDHSFCS